MSTGDKLVHEANQIARYFAAQPRENAAAAVADHLIKFWDPRMRRTAVALLDSGGEALEPVARAAFTRLRDAR
jgi:formate dehydrogenase subunit delta